MKTGIRAALAVVLGALALAVSTGALAHERGRHDVPRGHAWGHYKHYYKHYYKHHYRHHYPDHHHYLHHQVIRERVIVHQPPPVIYEQRAYYDRPAIVIGVDIPSLVVPLR